MHRLIKGDVLEVLPSLPDFACFFWTRQTLSD